MLLLLLFVQESHSFTSELPCFNDFINLKVPTTIGKNHLMRRKGSTEQSFFAIRDAINLVVIALKGPLKDKKTSVTRIAFWNMCFPNSQIPVVTQVKQHFVEILRRYSFGCTTAQQFCFEMAAFFIDLPTEFSLIVSYLPAPYIVAMHLAFRILHENIQYPSPSSPKEFIERASKLLPPSKFSLLESLIEGMCSESVSIDGIVMRVYNLMDIEVFDNFLIILPPFLRLHYSIKYGRPPPKVSIDFNKLDLPFEFIQAISDIDGPESVKDMILFNCFDEQNI